MARMVYVIVVGEKTAKRSMHTVQTNISEFAEDPNEYDDYKGIAGTQPIY